ncbi:MAG: bifunctional metallophosphatase/5'-nucleotidase [Pseudomonadota bacterium]
MKPHLLATSRLAAAASALALAAGAAQAEFTLDILHINDFHSRIESISKYDGTCSAEDEAEAKCFGGVARLVTAIEMKRAELAGANLLVLDAGDQYQGSLFYATYKGTAEAEFAEAIGFDAMAVGNHEFDDGPEGLVALLDAVSFPVLSGNIDVSAEPLLAGRVPATLVLDRGGEQIGIVSALAADTPETSSPGNNVVFSDEIESLTAQVAQLEAQGIDKIIALTHVGLPLDLRIAAAVPGIDVIVGGHSHTLLSSTDEDAFGPYPMMVEGPGGAPVAVVTAYAYGKYLGHLQVTFDDAGIVTATDGAPMLLDASITPDAATLARVTELAGPIEALMVQVVAESTAPIDGDRSSCRAGECEMGNLVADAMLDRVKDQGIQIAIQNGGGLRASIDAGPVTMGEVLTVLPFQNTLATFQLSGEQIIAALENGVSEVEDGAGRFPQVAGLKYSWTPDAPAGQRIVEVMVAEGDGYAPIDLAKIYGVVSNNFMRSGGDGYAVFTEAMNAYDFGPGLEQVVADYLADAQGYTPYLDGRITQQ